MPVERLQVFADKLALALALRVAGINGGEYYTVRGEYAYRAAQRGKSRFALGGAAFVAPGEPAEIEHTGFYRLFDIFREPVVRIVYKRVVLRRVFRGKAPARAFHRRELYIEGVNSAAFAHRAGQKQRIVAVSHGEIGADVAFFKMREHKVFFGLKYIKHFYKLRGGSEMPPRTFFVYL